MTARRDRLEARSTRGATMVEYALVVALVATGSLSTFEMMDENIEDHYEASASDIGTPDRTRFDVTTTTSGASSTTSTAAPTTTTAPATTTTTAAPTTTTAPATTTTTAAPTTTTAPPTTTTTAAPTTTTAPPTTTTTTPPAGFTDSASAQRDALLDMLDDPALDPNAAGEIENAIVLIDDALAEYADGVTDVAIKNLKDAIGKLERAQDEQPGLDMTPFMADLSEIGGDAARADVEAARAGHPGDGSVADADDFLAEGDALWAAGDYAAAADQYKKAADAVEDLLV